jgi:hypothetical protein
LLDCVISTASKEIYVGKTGVRLALDNGHSLEREAAVYTSVLYEETSFLICVFVSYWYTETWGTVALDSRRIISMCVYVFVFETAKK